MTGMTSVVLDATGLGGYAGTRGVGRYVAALAGALAERPDLELTALVASDIALPAGVRPRRVRRRLPGRFAPYEHDLLLPIGLARAGAQVAHQPAPEPARWARGPYVQTLHDAFPVARPDEASADERRRWRWYARRYRAADAVVAISRFSADEGVALLGRDPRRVHVALSAPDDRFRAEAPGEPADPPYLLMVSEWSPRKGYPEAFAVVSALADAGLPHRLVVSGRLAPWTEPEVRRLVAAAGRPDRIEVAGYVDDLPALYRGATAVLVTSRYEGFGFPAAEAMASGTPVIAFDNSATTEVVADGGVLVPDGDVPAMVAAVRTVLESPARRDELAWAGLARAGRLRWSDTAATYAAVYAEVAS